MLGEKCLQEATIALWINTILATLQKWLHWKDEGMTAQAVSSTVRSVPRRLQSARANCESSKGRKHNHNKGHGHGNKGSKARPSARLLK